MLFATKMVHQLAANILINNIDCSLLKHAAKCLMQQLSYLPRIGSRLMCILFECVYYIIQSCWKQVVNGTHCLLCLESHRDQC